MQLPEREESGNQHQLKQDSKKSNLRLTSYNLDRISHETDSQKLCSTYTTGPQDWEFVNVAKGRNYKTKSGKPEKESDRTGKTSASNKTTSSTKSISGSDVKFPGIIRKNGILQDYESTEPSNIDEIRKTFKRPRESPSPELKDFKRYRRAVGVAGNESAIQRTVLSLLKNDDDKDQKQIINQQFVEFPSNVGFNNGLSAAVPDFVEGYLEEAFQPYPIKDLLGGSAVSTSDQFPIALPHIVGEIKRRGGDFECGTCQAAYDAACLVYGRNHACISLTKIDEANTAHVGSFVSDGKRLLISVHFSATNASEKTVYHQCPIYDSSISMDYNSFKTGYRQIRNLQDWARGNACSIKDKLTVRYQESAAVMKEQGSPGEIQNRNMSEFRAGTNDDIVGK